MTNKLEEHPTFGEMQDFLFRRGFTVASNDGEVFFDVKEPTKSMYSLIKWADEHPDEERIKNVARHLQLNVPHVLEWVCAYRKNLVEIIKKIWSLPTKM